MSDVVTASVHVDDLFLVDCSFHVETSPTVDMKMNLEVEYKPFHFGDTANGKSAYTVLTVRSDLSRMSDPSDHRLDSMVSVYIKVSMKSSTDWSDEKKKCMEVDSLSIAYSHARSCLMTIGGLSPLCSYMIPAILPEELLDD